MELDELRGILRSLEQDMARYAVNLHRESRERRTRELRSRLWPLGAAQILQILSGLAVTAISALFWVRHLDAPALAFSGIVLHVYGIGMVAGAARTLHLLASIDYSQPVVAIQRQLTLLSLWRLRLAWVFGVASCLAWIPMVVIGFDMAFGIDLYESAPWVIASFLGSGLACLGVVLLLHRWLATSSRMDLVQRIRDHLVGRSVSRARGILDEISEFEAE
jgi:hypothetical protein